MPIPHLEDLWESTDYEFILAHVVQYAPYRDFYKSTHDAHPARFSILDNGMWETGEPMDLDKYAVLMSTLSCNQVIAPDYWQDPVKTIHQSDIFLDIFSHESSPFKDIEVMLVAQGTQVNESVDCVGSLLRLAKIARERSGRDVVTAIGIPLGIATSSEDTDLLIKGRVDVLSDTIGLIQDAQIGIHLLGAANPQELSTYNTIDPKKVIKRVDTGAPIKAAMKGLDYRSDPNGKKIQAKYSPDERLAPEVLDLALSNIYEMRKVIHG